MHNARNTFPFFVSLRIDKSIRGIQNSAFVMNPLHFFNLKFLLQRRNFRFLNSYCDVLEIIGFYRESFFICYSYYPATPFTHFVLPLNIFSNPNGCLPNKYYTTFFYFFQLYVELIVFLNYYISFNPFFFNFSKPYKFLIFVIYFVCAIIHITFYF